jgi:hypothetical protein
VIIQSRDTPNRNAVKIARAVEEVSKLLFPPPEGEDELKRKQLMQLAIIKGTFGAGIGSSAGGGGIQSGKKGPKNREGLVKIKERVLNQFLLNQLKNS